MYSSLGKEKTALSFAHFMFSISTLSLAVRWKHPHSDPFILKPEIPEALATVVPYHQWLYLYLLLCESPFDHTIPTTRKIEK